MRFDFQTYSIELVEDGFAVFLDDRRYAVLRPASAVDTADGTDVDKALPEPRVERSESGVTLTYSTASSLWNEKTYVWRFENDCLRHHVTVNGRGTLSALRFFDGASESVYGWSFFDFSQFFTPDCALLDQRYYKSMQYGCIDASAGQMSDVPQDPHAQRHYIFTPPPLCYGLGFSSGRWLGAGLAPDRGHYNFSRFEYVPAQNSFCFRLTYDGRTRVEGEWTSPWMVFCPSDDEYSALSACCEKLREWNMVDGNRHQRADWWSKPIFCGWGEQNVTAIRQGLPSAQPLARQDIYDGFLQILRDKSINPGTIVIDDKWQKHYGTCEVDTEKWPDLRGWIDARHAEGRKVLLWFGAWSPEGLSLDETIKDPNDNVVCADPTSHAYQSRIRNMLHRMLSPDPGCYNADGIKCDWTGTIYGPGYSLHGGIWGIELLKSLTKQIYDAAKAAKPDALIITHTANPYFSECTDMVRLNDIFVGCREMVSMMTHRQKIARLACPHALIDCDNSSAPDHTEWLEYTRMQPQLGVPSLYFLTGFDGTMERITDEDWDTLAPIWRRE